MGGCHVREKGKRLGDWKRTTYDVIEFLLRLISRIHFIILSWLRATVYCRNVSSSVCVHVLCVRPDSELVCVRLLSHDLCFSIFWCLLLCNRCPPPPPPVTASNLINPFGSVRLTSRSRVTFFSSAAVLLVAGALTVSFLYLTHRKQGGVTKVSLQAEYQCGLGGCQGGP